MSPYYPSWGVLKNTAIEARVRIGIRNEQAETGNA